jgi:protein TonB
MKLYFTCISIICFFVSSSQINAETINQKIVDNFNTSKIDSIADVLNLKKGSTERVLTKFTIDENGDLVNITAKGSNILLEEEEAIRLLKKLPKFEPIVVNGDPKKVNFSLPINFYINKIKKKKK